MDRQMNPLAKEFVPKSQKRHSILTQLEKNQLITPSNSANPTNRHGTSKKKALLVDELDKFIQKVTQDLSLFEKEVGSLVQCANGWIDENVEVPYEVVQTILSNAMLNRDFIQHGARLCMHLNQLEPERREFNEALTKTSWIDSTVMQEEQKDKQYYTEDLTLFIGDLYSRIGTPELGIGLLRLIKVLVDNTDDSRMKVSAQVLKLCGQNLDNISATQQLDSNCSTNYIIRSMEKCVNEHESISDNTRAIVESVINLESGGWAINYNGHNNHVNPIISNGDYANYDAGSHYNYEFSRDVNSLLSEDEDLQELEQNDYLLQGESVCEFEGQELIIPADEYQDNPQDVGYDFGNSDDEHNHDVCSAFEQFLSGLSNE